MKSEFDIRFFQIAEVEGNRVGLGEIDMSYHRYPFTLLFKGCAPGFLKRLSKIACLTWHSDADLSLLTGYEKPECWAQMLIIKLKRKKFAIFCDSTIHDNKQTFLKGLVKRFIFKVTDGIFCYGQRSREYVLHYGASPEKVFIRPQAAAMPRRRV